MPAVWNDGERCAEIAVEELEICLFNVQDILIDCTFRLWGVTPNHIEVQLGQAKFPLDSNDEMQRYIRKLAIGELLSNPRYAERVADADDMIDAADQGRYRRDVGYGHQQHELI